MSTPHANFDQIPTEPEGTPMGDAQRYRPNERTAVVLDLFSSEDECPTLRIRGSGGGVMEVFIDEESVEALAKLVCAFRDEESLDSRVRLVVDHDGALVRTEVAAYYGSPLGDSTPAGEE